LHNKSKKPEGENKGRPISGKLKEYHCSNCDDLHPRRRHTKSLPDIMKRSILNRGIPPRDTSAASCRFCNEPNESKTRCGACG
jgi:hypothetical protein